MIRVKDAPVQGRVRCDGTCRRGSYFAPLSVEVGTHGFPELSLSQDLRDE